jgi:DNA-binding beta-propeller fold protein YncE
VAVDPTGKFAYVTNGNDNTVSGFSIDGKTGALTPVPGSPFAAGTGPVSVAVDPTGQFAYVANDNTVSGYSIDGKTGTLTPVPGSPFAAGTGPVSVAVDPTGQFAYVANIGSKFGGTVTGFSIDGKTGALTPVAGSPFAAGTGPSSVAVDPRGQFAYVTNLTDNTVSGYSIDRKTGTLTPVPGSPFAAGISPSSIAVDPTGRLAYVANAGDNTVSAYSIGPDGALAPVPSSPFAAGTEPISVAITPLVPFATSFAKLEISRKGFDLNEFFTLGANSNGINPVTENVTLQIGTFSVTIPAGSFEQKPNGRFDFKGVINDVKLKAQIVPLGNNIFTFNAEGKGVDLTGLSNPVTVVLTIGIDSGTTAVTAEFEKRKKHHQPDDDWENTQPDDNGDEHE